MPEILNILWCPTFFPRSAAPNLNNAKYVILLGVCMTCSCVKFHSSFDNMSVCEVPSLVFGTTCMNCTFSPTQRCQSAILAAPAVKIIIQKGVPPNFCCRDFCIAAVTFGSYVNTPMPMSTCASSFKTSTTTIHNQHPLPDLQTS